MKQILKTYFSALQNEAIKIKAFIFKNWIMAKRNLFAFFEIGFWPLISFLSVGLLSEFADLSYPMKGFILIGVVAMSTIQVCQLDMAYVLLYDIWSKSIKHNFVAPIGICHFLIGSFIIGIIRGSAVFLILALLSKIVFDFNLVASDISSILIFLCALFLNAAMVGISVSILVFVVGYKAEVAAWSLVSLMFLICGIYYPISILPDWAQTIAKTLPLTYFLEYYRTFYGFKPFCADLLKKGFMILFAYLVFEINMLNIALKKAKQKGTLLKLSE